jgi:two-component system, OmpR family, phosphate regulon sensor histidine kinase PhoR
MRLRWRLPLAFVLTTLVLAGIVALSSALLLRSLFLQRLEDDMARQSQQFAAVLNSTTPAELTGVSIQSVTQKAGTAGEVRFTLIAHDGTVLGDSEVDPSTLANHADRPEIAQALAGHEGRARRESVTIGEQLVYVAIPLPSGDRPWSGGALRAALPAARIDGLVAASWRIPLIVWAILLLPTLAAGYLISRSITRPIGHLSDMTARVASGDFSYRTTVHRADELGGLANSLNSMAEQLEGRAGDLARESERSAGVLAAMSEGVILMDADGRLLRANPAAARVLGARFDGRQGEPMVHVARAFPAVRLAATARQAGHGLTEPLDLPTGRSLIVEIVPLQSERGKESQTLFVIRDETERRKTEEMRRDFVANASHELKTPLAGLSLLADTLAIAVREDPERAAEFAARLGSETRRLANLTNDLLTLSQLEEPRPAAPVSWSAVDFARLVRETVADMTPLAEGKQQELKVEGADRLLLRGDETELRTLVRNLLDNAIRHTEPHGHIVARMQAVAYPEGLHFARLSVEDDGPGIPAVDQERIFERFYRVDKARSRETGGTGLGLSIVKHVAESHGGTVEVESRLGVGSIFTVSLPC